MFVSLNNSGACGPATGIGSTYPTERGPSVASVSFERQPRWAPLDGLSENSVRHHPTQQPNAAAVRRRERRGCRATHEGEPYCRATSLEIEPEPRTTLPPNGKLDYGQHRQLLEEAFAATAEPVTKAPRWARDQRRASGVKTANTGGSRDCLDAPALFTPVLEEPRDRFDAPAASPPAPKKRRSLSPRIVRGRESRAFYNRRKSVGSLAEKPNWSPPAPDGLENATSQWCQNRQHWSKPRLPRRASVVHAST